MLTTPPIDGHSKRKHALNAMVQVLVAASIALSETLHHFINYHPHKTTDFRSTDRGKFYSAHTVIMLTASAKSNRLPRFQYQKQPTLINYQFHGTILQD
jgi:hypothetical protein